MREIEVQIITPHSTRKFERLTKVKEEGSESPKKKEQRRWNVDRARRKKLQMIESNELDQEGT